MFIFVSEIVHYCVKLLMVALLLLRQSNRSERKPANGRTDRRTDGNSFGRIIMLNLIELWYLIFLKCNQIKLHGKSI
jgi:hypothetical protein